MNYITLEDAEAEARWGPSAADPPSRTLPTFLASDLAGSPIPSREWLVPDLVPSHTVTLFFGDGGTGKSLAALQLATAVATGGRWLDRPVKSGRVLFLTAEDDRDELHRRLADISRAMSIPLDDLDGLKILALAGEDAVLAAASGKGGTIVPTPLWSAFGAEAEAFGPVLIIADTLADIYAGDENVRAQARQFIGMFRGLAIRMRAAALLLAHPSVAGMANGSGSSGSTGWGNSVRSRLYLSRVVMEGEEADPDLRVLTTKKANYTRAGSEIRLKWRDGIFEALDAPAVSSTMEMAAQARAERIFLELLDSYTAEGRPVSATIGANYAPTIFSRDQRASGTTKRALVTAMNTLFSGRHIVMTEYGPPSKRRVKIARREPETDDI